MYKELTRWIMKTNTSLSLNVLFLSSRELTYDNNKTLFYAQKHKTLTMLSLTTGNISLALCSTILAALVARECRIFHNPKTFLSHIVLWVANEFTYKNPTDIASYL
jgi:hypothetical protein